MKPVKVATLVSMYVRPAYRRDRIGGRMVDEFRSWAKESGAGSAQMTAYASNAEAIRFYERNGFASQSVTLGATLLAGVTETLEHGTPQGNTASQLRYTDTPRLRERQHLRHAPNLHNHVRRRQPILPSCG
ncbi:GNAT family N-acetyltransferase [Streptomyces sp. NPDC059697]|uniref:GNAT family N-acetyltransferase n=1 Tax=Streptomyces sp. NPDC059697 TaxID=3346912 RepID=UPI003690CBFB